MSIFVDSWAWLAVSDDRDPDHVFASIAVSDAIEQGHELVTSDYVLSECITSLFRDLGPVRGAALLRKILKFLEDADIVVEWVGPARFEEALRLRFLYDDKPKISFTDFTSMTIMEELEIREIITRDRHFRAVNRGFQLLPDL